MSRAVVSFLFAIPAFLASGISSASTLSSVSAQASPPFGVPFSGATDCSQSSSTSASCNIQVYVEMFRGGSALANISASSAFGSLTGQASATAENDSSGLGGLYIGTVQAQFTSVFSDPVLITGGAGNGTLQAHFSWTVCSWTLVGNSYVPGYLPSFSASAGTSTEAWTGSTSGAGYEFGCSGFPGGGTLDLSTPFSFGGYVTIAASTDGEVISEINENDVLSPAENFSSASLTLTGFTVLDASGNLVPGAEVTPILTPMLTPEPASISLLICGKLALWATALVARSRHPHRTG